MVLETLSVSQGKASAFLPVIDPLHRPSGFPGRYRFRPFSPATR
jgi:hypothetical protein